MERYRVFTCPFCGRVPESPQKIDMQFGETCGGRCECGAIYVYDETGRMLGEAFVDALALLYGGDYDAAFSASEDDYEEEVISFDKRTNKYIQGGNVLSKASKFLFLRKK
ncbi:MAG: hypothetical protein M0Z59_10480 [Nitrospiraceae bacterium]|nr:hypothetical protein [Nitrospiraceae bacterium]